MTKSEFLAALEARLAGLSQGDVQRSLDFYGEMIDDRMEDGMTEAEAVANVGEVDDIAAKIRQTVPESGAESVPNPAEKTGKRRGPNPWVIGFTSPLWILLWILAIVLAIVLWTVAVSFYIVATVLGVCGAVFHVAAAVLAVTGQLGQGLLVWGAGVFLMGFCVLWGWGTEWLSIGVAKLCKQVFRGLRRMVAGKGESA